MDLQHCDTSTVAFKSMRTILYLFHSTENEENAWCYCKNICHQPKSNDNFVTYYVDSFPCEYKCSTIIVVIFTSPPASGMAPQKDIIVFTCQMSILFIVIISCVINVSLGMKNELLWISLLSSSIGYVLPNPKAPQQWQLKAGESLKFG